MYESERGMIFLNEYIRQQCQPDQADREHGDKQDRAEKVERLADSVQHDQPRKRDEIDGYRRIIFVEIVGLKVRNDTCALYRKNENDRARHGPAQHE